MEKRNYDRKGMKDAFVCRGREFVLCVPLSMRTGKKYSFSWDFDRTCGRHDEIFVNGSTTILYVARFIEAKLGALLKRYFRDRD